MDFFKISVREIDGGPKKGQLDLFPDFTVGRSKDLMVRGKGFYAIWDEEKGLWSTDEYDVQRLVDAELQAYADKHKAESNTVYNVKYLKNFANHGWAQFRKYMQNISDNSHQLDETLTFANTEVKRSDYVSMRLPYALEAGDYDAWDELVGTLYSVEERAKIEWAIGAIVSGDSKRIQKFLVLYGPAGTGKSTILNIVLKLFEGYTTSFEAKALGSNNNAFATEAFQNNPLVAIQQDGDLSKIEDNTKLNSVISHEFMTMNVKFKSAYTSRINAFLLMGTNQPVKISDAKSGIIRRLIDVHPTGVKLPENHYNTLMAKIDFELGAIAYHCLETYRAMGKNYYSSYKPLEMMLQTDVFFNYIEAYYDVFAEQNGASLTQAYLLYKEFCEETGIQHVLPKYKFRSELQNYFDDFKDRAMIDGEQIRSYYSGFNASKFKSTSSVDKPFSLVVEESDSLLDEELANCPAQYAKSDGTPAKFWTNNVRMIGGELREPKAYQVVSTVLGELDSSKEHYVRPPEDHIVIDFDLTDETGEKSLERNLEAASVWPATYAELSKSGEGVHLHYIYDGDTDLLSPEYSSGIEVKVFRGNSALRRRVSKCNNVPIATINSGLPTREKKVAPTKTFESEKHLRDLIVKNLQKKVHPSTVSSVSFIKELLDQAYTGDMPYDVIDLRPKITTFANNSSNQAMACLKMVMQMKFSNTAKDEKVVGPEDSSMFGEDSVPRSDMTPKEKVEMDLLRNKDNPLVKRDDRLVFWDVEVYPNLFIICWKYQGKDASMVRMVNPKAEDVAKLLELKLVGFNNRRYDNHIIYAAAMGQGIDQLYKLSQKIIDNDKGAMYAGAYDISYADIYDFTTKKQGLKKYQIELGIPHKEMDLPWDQPVDPKHIPRIVEYCCNDVLSTEATFESRKGDFTARKILADLSGLKVNDTTAKHTARIIFGKDRNPQAKFVYTHLKDQFPGYFFDMGKSTYRDEVVGEGGYVYAEPGMYENVALLDVASMHPTSMEQLNLFGSEYTKNFSDIKAARMAIKHKKYDQARKMFGGRLAPFLDNEDEAEALSYALKIAINTVYGLTSAKFDNPFRDIRNRDNIVAKRGALFMIDLKHFVQEKGFKVVHIKTDSIKIPNATEKIIAEVTEFGKKYGYDFEHEATYDKFCLVNDAVYIAKKGEKWEAVGAQFAHPYIHKTLFTGEQITFDDMCETKQVSAGTMYLDLNGMLNALPKDAGPEDFKIALDKGAKDETIQFIGRTGRFVPVTDSSGGGKLYRIKDNKAYAVTGTTGHEWMESTLAQELGDEVEIDMTYFDKLLDKAKDQIAKFGDVEEFIK